MYSQKREKVRDMKREVGAYPTAGNADRYFRRRKGTVKDLMTKAGIEPYAVGNSKRYAVEDIIDVYEDSISG